MKIANPMLGTPDMKTVDVHDLQQRMGQLRAEVRRKEDVAAAAQRSAKAERQITEAAHKVGRVVVNVCDHACRERLAAAHALAFGRRDFGHTTVEEAMKMTGKQLQTYLQFHKQEVHTWDLGQIDRLQHARMDTWQLASSSAVLRIQRLSAVRSQRHYAHH
ncbi:hypothetical protein QJQ45_011336 [Haematococcus lacustris]|nr:hypothetical protein QJQ45_011336 [Haematococcus lacustris]